ncbi:syntaxin-4-like [Hypanus sabinus]|uniref:syntaxin-4-like n=1 Tax=Hypanus sabinus TaxID=79690 RepID=UPI0028C3EF95|nr:syntaxin-4-like [Hypanus sabinus]
MRDRTKELRQGVESSEDEGARLVMNLNNDDANQEFFHQVKEVRQGISQLQELVNQLDTTQRCILSSPVPGEGEKSHLQKLRDDVKTVASSVRGKLKQLEVKNSLGNEDPLSVTARMRRTQHDALTREFVEVMNQCHNLQSQYRDRNVERIQRQLKITGMQLTEEEVEAMLESGKQDIFTANIIQDTQVTKQAMSEIESRHTEILRLEKSICELHDMFMYLALEVEAQGEMINNIENTVSTTVNYVEKAADNTASAATSRRKALKKKMCLIVCVVFLVLVVIAIIVSVALTS